MASDDMGDMRGRVQLMNDDRKALMESTQSIIKQNKELLKSLKSENKELHAALSDLQQQSSKKEKSGDLVRLEADAADYRRKYDDVRSAAIVKQREVNGLIDKLKDLEKDNGRLVDQDTPLTRQIRTLENRLDKAMIKYNEAQSIRKTYEQIVKRLKEERIGFDNQLAAIERTLRAKEKDLEELVLMSHDAQHAKEMAKAELSKLELQIAEERRAREKELSERRLLVQQKKDMNLRLEKREQKRREEAQSDVHEEDSAVKKTAANAFSAAASSNKQEEEDAKITTYEDAFRKIKDATGVSDVNEVIQKFLTQDETHNNLVAMTKEAQAKIDQLNEEKAHVKAKVEEIKYSGTGSLGSRRIVDEFESHLSEANGKCERNKQKYERVAKMLINVKAGIEHLSDKLEVIKIDQPPIVLTDDTVVEVLQHCELKLMKLTESVDILHKDEGGSAAASRPSAADAAGEEGSAQYNIRISLPREADNDSYEEDYEDDDQEEVYDRESVKKYSFLMLEKANKKQKRQKKKKMGKAEAAAAVPSPTKGAVAKGTKAGIE